MAVVEALVQHGARDLRLTEVPFPELEEGAGILRVEACGLCGSDIEALDGESGSAFPRVMGHEIVGTVEALGPGGRRDVQVGDRVAVDPWLPCGGCRFCLAGQAQLCNGWSWKESRLACYGFIAMANEPGLWGGYSSHVYIHPKTVLYPIPDGLGPLDAALWNPLAAGIEWAVLTPRTAVGSTVAILGCGQRGLTATVAAKAAGASRVLVTGLAKDAPKLELAREFGADLAVDVENEELRDRARELIGGGKFDVVVDTASFSTRPVVDALTLVRPGGQVVFAGLKAKDVDGFPVDKAIMKNVTMTGVLGVSSDAYRRAVDLLASRRFPLERMRTHVFDYRDAVEGIDTLAGRVEGEAAINVVLSHTG
jgi:threonine dehydrogenase-like Zn-dependent dehydrogenase